MASVESWATGCMDNGHGAEQLRLLELMAVWMEETSELLGCAVRASGL